MVIAVNTRLLLKDRLEGIGWFMHENLLRITRGNPGHTFIFLFDRPYSDDYIYGDNVKPVIVSPPTRHPLLWYLWFEHRIPGVISKYRADIYMGPDGYMPLKLKIPSHITIHDINFHHRPEDLPVLSRYYYRRYFPRFAERAERIATVSEYSKTDIASSYGISPSKIDIVYNGVNELFAAHNETENKQYRESLTGGNPYFLFVGSLHPRKNIARLLQGFDKFRSKFEGEFRLLIVGEKMFMTGEMNRVYNEMNYRGDVIFTGRMSPDNLCRTLSASSGLTFVTLFEGFGIPLLEAMKCNVPILASDRTSVPEVAGKAAIYANPEDPDEIAQGMMQLASDPGLCSRLKEEGQRRIMDFNWDKTASLLWESICNSVDSRC